MLIVENDKDSGNTMFLKVICSVKIIPQKNFF
jgi:hypothetical protein